MSKQTGQVLTLNSIGNLLDQKLDEKLAPLIKTVGELQEDVTSLKTDVSGLKEDVGNLKEDVKYLTEDMDIVKKFLTTEVMTKADSSAIMSIVSRHTKEIKELQAIANY